jgi:dihydroxyacetone synthase
MAAISNGLAAFNKGTILPVTSSFFMFYLVSPERRQPTSGLAAF